MLLCYSYCITGVVPQKLSSCSYSSICTGVTVISIDSFEQCISGAPPFSFFFSKQWLEIFSKQAIHSLAAPHLHLDQNVLIGIIGKTH